MIFDVPNIGTAVILRNTYIRQEKDVKKLINNTYTFYFDGVRVEPASIKYHM